MDNRTCLRVKPAFSRDVPDDFPSDDLRLSEEVLSYLIERYSRPGDVIFDPFAGMGTTLLVSERLDRVAYGIERDMASWSYAQQILTNPERMIFGDVRTIGFDQLPKFSLTLSSPLYMNSDDGLDPLSGFEEAGHYSAYIRALSEIYDAARVHSVRGGRLIVEAANLKRNGVTTMFAWDLARALAGKMRFEGELILDWAQYGYGFGYSHSYCLVFET
ncbi:MAG: DNA methyltransferase [Myxococcota bacterium]